MKRSGFILLLVLWFTAAGSLLSQTLLPRPEPPRLVNDLAGVLLL